MYQVRLADKKVEKQLNNLPSTVFDRVDKSILNLKANPRPAGARKIKSQTAVWRLRIGDYRILYDIDDKKRMVIILEIRHRREAYR
jgi:mRNA interferase RelE/StbE